MENGSENEVWGREEWVEISPWSLALIFRKAGTSINEMPESNFPRVLLHFVYFQLFFDKGLININFTFILIEIQFTHFKCTMQWFLVSSQWCAIVTTIDFRTFYHLRK